MKIEFLREKMALSAIACALALFASPIAFAQGGLFPKQLTSDLVAKAPNLTAGASSGRLLPPPQSTLTKKPRTELSSR